jgi:hypothetical protein
MILHELSGQPYITDVLLSGRVHSVPRRKGRSQGHWDKVPIRKALFLPGTRPQLSSPQPVSLPTYSFWVSLNIRRVGRN